jgi:CO/xanthine dehydrogenase Mo-binding subunit
MTYQSKPLPQVELTPLSQVGQPLRRTDALSKVVGATLFAGDYSVAGMLHAKVLRSLHPHARINRVDALRARALPGVVCVLTAADVPSAKLAGDMPGQTGMNRRTSSDVQLLASKIVRYVGEPIALVAAETLDIAERALSLIEVDYEPLPGVFDPLEAMKTGAPVVNEPDNIVSRWKIRKGDIEAGMAQADLIVENTFRVPFQEHAYLEPEAGMAWVDEKDVINIRVSTQVVEHYRSIAFALGVQHDKIHILGTMVGGGFGGKEDITVEIFLGLLAKFTHRPVRLVYTREESFLAHSKRHPFIITHRTGVRRDGKITAAKINLVADSGAYPYLSPYAILYAAACACGPYFVDNVHVDSVAVATNNPFTSAFRGFGAPQPCFAYEQQMDAIANELGMNPFEFRKINYFQTGDRNATGQVMESAVWLEETASRAMDELGEKTPDHGPIKVGQGFASYMQPYGRLTWLHDTSQAWVSIELDGSVVIRCGVPDLGGGQTSSLCQITSEVLGVPMDRITIYSTDSAVTPLAGTTTATRQLSMSGNAVLKAARAIRETLVERASFHFEVLPEEIDLANSHAFVKTNPSEKLKLSALVAMCAADGSHLGNLALHKAPFSDKPDPETGQGRYYPDFTFGAHAVEVAVDTETGEVTILKSVGCHDVGRAINPAAVDGQIQGGAVQGLGYALIEDLIVKDGRIMTPSLAEYLIPTSRDCPTTRSIILESGTGLGPFGAKGIGEPALTPVAPAVANAVANAIGTRIFDLPLTPEKILRAISK